MKRKKPEKGVKRKKHSIQALGHSYAAARPRRLSETYPKRAAAATSASGEDGDGGGSSGISVMMYPCDQCEKTFPQPYRLNRHIREVHLKVSEHGYDCLLL